MLNVFQNKRLCWMLLDISSWPLVVLSLCSRLAGDQRGVSVCCVSRKAWSGPGLSPGDIMDIMDSPPASGLFV